MLRYSLLPLALLAVHISTAAAARPITFAVRLPDGSGISSDIFAGAAFLRKLTQDEAKEGRLISGQDCYSGTEYRVDPESNRYTVVNNPSLCKNNQVVFLVKRRPT